MVSGGYCPAHKLASAKRSAAAEKWHRLYGLPQWKRLRAGQLAAEPFCRRCGARGTEVDHIIPHRGDLARFLDAGNLQTLCHRCHSRKTLAENRESFRTKR